MENTDVSYGSKQFIQATHLYLNEIDTFFIFFLLIGQKVNTNIRTPSDFGKIISHLANVLYGTTSKLDTEFIFNKIVELVQKTDAYLFYGIQNSNYTNGYQRNE